jgi:UDP-N-acetylmuramoyl-L-alanyl-D-glutamate--2,6-diaminopimelate ligase
VRLTALLADADLYAAGVPLRQLRGAPEAIDIAHITLDSRHIDPGTLYSCVVGAHHDGHDFAPEAVAAGAVALLCERPLDLEVAQIVVDQVRPALGPLADALYGHPSRALTVVGVTGTNGKTTTTQLLAAIFQAAGLATATVGTLSGTRTTPEAPLLQATLAGFRTDGVAAVTMEVSSHALIQHRTDAVHFAAAVFTNLTRDHLDYHATMTDYFEAKARLFRPGRADMAVVNADDQWGRVLLDRLQAETGHGAGQAPVLPFSHRDVEDLQAGPDGSRFRWHGVDVRLRLGGAFNVTNAVAAATTARALGVGDRAIAEGLGSVESVRGRFEPIRMGQQFAVFVDYAHTPDGLEQALSSARQLTTGRLSVVFGAGGDRDHAKRPLMGEVAARIADLVVLTSDNPRSEDPEAIMAEVRSGMRGPGHVVVEVDRARAIGAALAAAGPGDVVVIAGKGHETYQELAGRVTPFDDAEVARQALRDIVATRLAR